MPFEAGSIRRYVRLTFGLGACLCANAQAAFTYDASGSATLSLDNLASSSPLTVTETALTQGEQVSFGSAIWLENALFGKVSQASAAGFASVEPGRLKARLRGEAIVFPGAPNVPTITHGTPRVNAGVGAQFRDDIVVTSAGLPFGTPVQIQTTVEFSVVVAAGGHAGPQFSGWTSGSLYFTYFIGNTIGSNYFFPNGLYTQVPTFSFSLPVVLNAAVGDTIPVGASLGLGADNRDGWFTDATGSLDNWAGYGWGMGGFTGIDASHTAEFFLDAITPNVTLAASSGHNYSISAVPLPAAWALLACCIPLVRRRRR